MGALCGGGGGLLGGGGGEAGGPLVAAHVQSLELGVSQVAELVHTWSPKYFLYCVHLTLLQQLTHGPGGPGLVVLLILPQVGGEDAEPPLVLGPGVVFLPELLPELGELELVLIRAVKEGSRRLHSAQRRPLSIFFNQTTRQL